MGKSIKVALVNPKGGKNISSASPPYNLAYLASYLKKYSQNTKIIIIDGLAGQDIKKELLDFKPDVIGITATTPVILSAYQIADFSKQNLKDSLIIIGGVHASTMPEEALKHVDIVIVGEGEIAMLEIIKKFGQKQKITEKIITRPYIKDLDTIPSPAWHLIDMEFYIDCKDNTAKTIPYAPLMARAITLLTSRGCPYRCIFCHNSWRATPTRYYSAKRVVKEIEYLHKTYGIDSVFFADDEFLANQPRVEEICRLINRKKLNKKIIWGCQARSDTICRLGLKNLKLIKNAGCTMISIGMESGSQRILDILKNKSTTVQHNKEAAILCHQAGLSVSGSFMLGLPSETKQDMLKTYQFIQENQDYIDFIGTGITTPYPGTKLWQWCVKENLIPNNIDYSNLCPDPRFDLPDWRIFCQTMPKNEFRSLFKKINQKAAQITTIHNIMKGNFSMRKLIRIIIKHPFYSSKYFFKQPQKVINLLKKMISK